MDRLRAGHQNQFNRLLAQRLVQHARRIVQNRRISTLGRHGDASIDNNRHRRTGRSPDTYSRTGRRQHRKEHGSKQRRQRRWRQSKRPPGLFARFLPGPERQERHADAIPLSPEHPQRQYRPREQSDKPPWRSKEHRALVQIGPACSCAGWSRGSLGICDRRSGGRYRRRSESSLRGTGASWSGTTTTLSSRM